jgi:hypothetical protein
VALLSWKTRPASLKAAVWVLLAPAVAITQDNPDFILPGLEDYDHLMADLLTVKAEVTFANPIGIGAVSALEFGSLNQNLADLESVTVAPDNTVTDPADRVEGGPQAAASLTVAATPGMPITILVDEVVPGAGYALTNFRCNYNTASDTACDGPGYSETSVADGTLFVGVTLIGNGNAAAGAADGSFAVTISYQ